MTRVSIAITIIFVISALVPSIHARQPKEQAKEWEYNFFVIHQKQLYEIDAPKKVFRSAQEITLENRSEKPVKEIYFIFHPDLVIDEIRVRDEAGLDMKCSTPLQVGTETLFNKYTVPVQRVATESPLRPGKKFLFHLRYHLKPAAVLPSPKDMYALTISSKASYSIGPLSGNNPYFGRNVTSPFEMALKYPSGNHSCAPGELTSQKKTDGYILDTYSSTNPNIPTFSCAPYQKVVRQRGNIKVEYYLYPHEKFSNAMVDNLFQAVNLYFEYFGENHTNTYRFATVGMLNCPRPGGENKGNAIFFPDYMTDNYNKSESGKIDYAEFLYHEVFHNWNIFFLHWQGPLYEFFVEGGANFICSWAVEKTMGPQAGIYVRNKFIKRLINQNGISSPVCLWNIQKSGKPEKALIYTYGALVWQQLRIKLGDPAFFAGLKDFFAECEQKTSDYKGFCRSFAKYSKVQVAEFLKPWVTNNQSINIIIDQVNIVSEGRGFVTEVTANCDTDMDLEIASSLGYRTAENQEPKILPIKFTQTGKKVFTFRSRAKPVYIEIDPQCMVPRINTGNRTWRVQKKPDPGLGSRGLSSRKSDREKAVGTTE